MKLVAAVFVLISAYLFQKELYRRIWNRNLKVVLKFNKGFIECNETANLSEIIYNDKFLPLPVLHVKFAADRSFLFEDMENSVVTDYYHRNDAFSVLGNQKVTRSLTFQGTKRGFYRIENANILVKDFFMTSSFARTISSDAAIYVFPEKLDISALDPMYQGMLGEISCRRSIICDNMTFQGLRDYQSFDSYKSINWKASAKSNELKVNIYDFTMDAEVRILINLDTDSMIKTDRLLEESIGIASTAARQFLKDKVRVSLITNGEDSINHETVSVRAGGDLSHGITIDKYLSRISGSRGKDCFLQILEKELMKAEAHVLYLIVSPYHKNDLKERLDQMSRKGLSVNMVVPYYDRLGFVPEREYMTGWEVSIYED